MTAPPADLTGERIIADGASLLGIPLSVSALRSMTRHLAILSQWGTHVNLSAIRSEREMAIYHVLDSLCVFKVIGFGQSARILDVGSGAGFPGLTLKIADPRLQLTLLDKNPKKIAFLKFVSHSLGHEDNRFLLNTLLRLAGDPTMRGAFDVVVSRGFAVDSDALEAFTLLIGASGGIVRMLGPRTAESHTYPPSLKPSAQWEGKLPFSESFRKIVLLTPRD